ncbi:nitroreductase [Xanthobacter autotrophicus]|uniref:nitroreductase family protein n=1 Tax=Xanthobacter TaxID=279 RepID=UPI0024AC1DFE|nr:nitroreductase [Xanthobacter autotrophicus]MDI4665178.1 nitroreductase [Xanthobacter autotrophicus]
MTAPVTSPVPRHHHQPAATAPLEPIAIAPSDQTLALLETRRSLPLRALVEPGPDAAALDRMLAIAARVPDHGRLVPWRFIVLEGEARAAAGDRLDALYAAQNPGLGPDKAHMWRDYLLRAPVTVVVVSRTDAAAKIPAFNQILSAGAAAMNLVVAATAMGFSALWLLKWPGRDPDAAALLGVDAAEKVAGFIHIGRPAARAEDRPRPSLDAVVTRWHPEG